ncbi:MAG: hypothetical protein Q7R49_07275 [Candidatus Daviesbacteria bacterium]|nr:hypothetical protein [Candidatus Daviesbacteria bacterium]
MNKEKIAGYLQEFSSRPFDKAASKLAYATTDLLPWAMGSASVAALFTGYSPRQLILYWGISATTIVLCRWFQPRIVKEAAEHGLQLEPPKSQNNRGKKP